MDELTDGDFISVYPNPSADGHFNILFRNIISDSYTIEVINILSQIVYEEEINISGNKNASVQIDLSNLNKGIYLLNVFNSNSGKHQVIIIQ